jgi:hypothetical protein
MLIEEEEEYEVEDILDSREHRGRTEYLVKWKGYPEWTNSWETERNLANAKESLDAFRGRRRPAIKTPHTRRKPQRQRTARSGTKS